MPLVSLIGEHLALKGTHFQYRGPQNECRNCRLKTVCFNLKPGRLYEITEVREKQHHCNLHEGNVCVIEVKELPISAALPTKLSKGMQTKIFQGDCPHIGCDFFELCVNDLLPKEKSYTILKVSEKLSCPIGKELYKAELTD